MVHGTNEGLNKDPRLTENVLNTTRRKQYVGYQYRIIQQLYFGS